MEVSINGQTFNFVSNTINAIKDDKLRNSYFNLTYKVFGLDFIPWYKSGYSGNNFIPHTLFLDDVAISSVGVAINNFKWHNNSKKYIQISTVATDPDYRQQGLSKWLMELVLEELHKKCDCIYLYANDSVINFYPKFGFIPAHEYRYSMPVTKRSGDFRKIDLSIKKDVDLLIEKHIESNPFALLAIDKNIGSMMFHCINFLSDNIYYVEKYDAVVIAEQENSDIFCYDVYTKNHCDLGDILGIIASEGIHTATLGFTPSSETGYTIEKAIEKDSTFFVLDGKENILADNKVTFPFLSRA
ncbi:MAG: GNAT family N-acetyltransferase [Defluviitaleaceae bacterium]|nr:GNAT family N-acetyltransferase [Defluviitaleaceae bacterium]